MVWEEVRFHPLPTPPNKNTEREMRFAAGQLFFRLRATLPTPAGITSPARLSTSLTPLRCIKPRRVPWAIRGLATGTAGGSGGAKSAEVFLQGAAANYIEAMHEAWRKDPTSVHVSWQV